PGGSMTGWRAGAPTIPATSEGVNGTAALTVTAPPPPPPPGTWPNEPAGLTPITDWSFSALSGSGWSGWGGTLGVDPTAPASPPSNWEVLFPIGFVAGNSPGQRNFGFAPLPTELFIGVWWKPSNPWQYQSVGDKIFYVTDVPWRNGTGVATSHMDPVWGGIGGTKAENDYFWYDHVYLSGR